MRMKRWPMLLGCALVTAMAALPVLQQTPDGGPVPGGGGGPGGAGFDPQQFMQFIQQRMMDNLKIQLAATDDEWTALQPKIQAVTTLQQQNLLAGRMGGLGGLFLGGGPGGGNTWRMAPNGGTASTQPSNPVADASRALQETLSNKDATPAQIKENLMALRDARSKAHLALVNAQNDLKALLTLRQEAILVQMGILE